MIFRHGSASLIEFSGLWIVAALALVVIPGESRPPQTRLHCGGLVEEQARGEVRERTIAETSARIQRLIPGAVRIA